MPEYIHKSEKIKPPVYRIDEPDERIISEDLLDYQDKKLLVLRATEPPYTRVLGFVKDKNYRYKKTPEGLEKTKFDLLPEESKEDIEKFLHKKGFGKKPYFR